jgi:hypothetical protein
MAIKLTPAKPKKEGYYWWTNFGEHTPTVVEVKKESDGSLWADNGEYFFQIEDHKDQLDLFPREVVYEVGRTKYYEGDELWGYIENPQIGKEQIEPNSF